LSSGVQDVVLKEPAAQLACCSAFYLDEKYFQDILF
jgi:hypothetical protein